jgi:putative endonuclease
MKDHNYFVYITTNPKKTVLYVGVTNNLYVRMEQHFEDNVTERKTFAGKYFCYNLIYWERFQYVQDAIAREKEVKGWRREKKEELINTVNPTWEFLNDTL